MVTVLKWAGILFTLLILLLVSAIMLLDWNWVKTTVAQELSQMTGRTITAGDVDVDFFWPPEITLTDIRIENPDWAREPYMAKVDKLVASVELGELITGDIVLPQLTIIEPDIVLAVSPEGKRNWTFKDAKPEKQDQGLPTLPVIKQLRIEDGHVVYRNRALDPTVTATLTTLQAQGARTEPLSLEASGQLQDKPLTLSVTGGPLADFYGDKERYPVELNFDVADTTGRIEGTLRQAATLQGLDLNVAVDSSAGGVIASLLGVPATALPGYGLQADVSHQDQVWQVTALQSHIGESDLTGELMLKTAPENPAVRADLASNRLNVNQLEEYFQRIVTHFQPAAASQQAADQTSAASGSNPSPVAAPPLPDARADYLRKLQQWTAQVEFHADNIQVRHLDLNDVALDVTLKDGQLQVAPLDLAVADGTANLTLSLDAAQWPVDGSVSGQLQRIDLAQLLEPLALTEEQLGLLSGELGLKVTGMARDKVVNNDLILPLLGRLIIEPSQLTYTDSANDTVINLALASEGLEKPGEQTVRIDGDGRYLGRDFDFNFRGDPLLDLRDPEKPYALDMEIDVAQTNLRLDGWVNQPLNLRGLNMNLWIKGSNPSRLYPLIGIALPDLPPYKLEGKLTHRGDGWQFTDIDGEVGDSDISGVIRFDLRENRRPFLRADLASRELDLDDLGGLIGAAPGTGPGETATPAQQQQAAEEAKDRSILPSDPINLERLRAVDARVNYTAQRIQARKIPLSGVTLDANLDQGHLLLEPLKFSVGDGSVVSQLDVKAGDRPIEATLETEIKQVNLKKVLQYTDIADESVGMVGGRAKFWMQGDSIDEMLASADGGLFMLMTGGQLDDLLTELAGLDGAESLVSLLGDQDDVPIRCAFVNIHAADGMAELKNTVMDTADTVFVTTGSVNLNEERLDLVIEPHPKDVSIFSARSPLHLEGPFINPQLYPGPGALATRAAIAATLGVVAGPVGALLPLIEPGLGEDSGYCQGLLDGLSAMR